MSSSHSTGSSEAARVLSRVREALRAHPDHRGGVLLAVSGGADSILLLTACAPLHREGLRLEVAWIDHGVRSEAADEGAFVEALARSQGLIVHARSLGLSAGPGFEARAREAREAALEAVRDSRGLSLIATGHTASDQAETLLMRLSRGAALRGAAGILERKGRVVRPMLALARDEVRQTLRQLGVAWCDDAMNADRSFFRVRVRHEALPALTEAAGFDVTRGLSRFAALAAEDDAWLEEEATRALVRLSLPMAGVGRPIGAGREAAIASSEPTKARGTTLRVAPQDALDVVGLRALAAPIRRRALHGFLRQQLGPLSSERLSAALEAVLRGGHCQLREDAVLSCEGGRVRVVLPNANSRVPEPSRSVALPVSPEGITWDGGGGRWRLGITPTPVAVEGAVRYPLTSPPGPLEIRARRKGDRVVLWNGQSRPVAELMIDAKLPRELRASWPLIAEVGGPVRWVPGASRAPISAPAVAWLWALGPT